MSAYIEVEQPSRLRRLMSALWNQLGCVVIPLAVLLVVGLVILFVYFTYQAITGYSSSTEQTKTPAWVQSGIDVQQCPVNERVTAYEMQPGLWKVDCVGE